MRAWVVLGLLLCFGCGSRPTRHAAAITKDRPHVSVMTFNVNYGMAGDRRTRAAAALQGADVVFLQETTDEWEVMLRSEFGNVYSHMEFKGWAGAGGLGVMSKLPIESIEYLPAENWFPAARVIVKSPVGRLQVLSVHLRPPISDSGSVVSGYLKTPPIREHEIATFAKSLDGNLPTLVVGDFNESESGKAVTWLEEHGWKSALPEFEPYAKTWRWTTSVGTIKGRYDHLCYNKMLEPLKVEVREAGRSDHLPVVGVFGLAGES